MGGREGGHGRVYASREFMAKAAEVRDSKATPIDLTITPETLMKGGGEW